MATATAKRPGPLGGSRASGQVRLAEMLLAGIAGRPDGMRETMLVWLAAMRLGCGLGQWQTWNPRETSKALARLEAAGLVRPVDEPEGRRWVATAEGRAA